jgi:hypothetical protein
MASAGASLITFVADLTISLITGKVHGNGLPCFQQYGQDKQDEQDEEDELDEQQGTVQEEKESVRSSEEYVV